MIKFKSAIKSKKFYQEAENMQKGWGNYLKSIDKLKDAVNNKKNIGLNDACWVLYGEGYCSSVWEEFEKFCIKNGWRRKKMPWEAWDGIFKSQLPD